MLAAMFAVIATTVVLAWCIAAWSTLSILRVAPKGGKLQTYFDIGWWRFEKVRATVGSAAEPHLARYRLSCLLFFVLIFAMIAMILAIEVLQLATWPEL